MRLIGLAIVLAVSLLLAPLAADAQQPTKVPRIAVLWPISDDPNLEAFRQGLRSLGYVEGQSILIDYRFAGGKDALLPDLAAQLVRLNPDVILTWTVVGARVAKQATTTIPIVNGSMSDPVAAGLVPSLARPGGNLTGLTSFSPVLSAKRLELIKEVVPGLSRVALLSTAHPSAGLALRETEVAAQSLRIRLQALDVRGPDDFDGAFLAMAREHAGALVLLLDPLFLQHMSRLVDLAAKHRLPAMYWAKQYVEAGGLISYASSSPDQFRRAAGYVDKILKGAKPADLPIEAPTKFELVINLKTAKRLDSRSRSHCCSGRTRSSNNACWPRAPEQSGRGAGACPVVRLDSRQPSQPRCPCGGSGSRSSSCFSSLARRLPRHSVTATP
jgi:putative tryptophan/tyrosine transport system substrate-binding protein